jgi:hypothetical protein
MKNLPWGAIGRALLLVLGVVVVTLLIRNAGPAKVAAILSEAWIFFPLLALCEMGMVACDVSCVRWQLGERRKDVPLRSWIWSSTYAYALQILFPAGRAAGEVARASVLGRHVGFARAAAASVGYQASNLYAVATLSLVATAVSFFIAGPIAGNLPKFEAINVVIVASIGTFIATVLRSKRATEFVAKRFKLSEAHQDELRDAVEHSIDVKRGAFFCVTGRGIQWFQYALCVFAIGGRFGLVPGSIAHGIQLVGATMGDVIPNQLGAVEGAYTAFAGALALTPDRVLALPLLIRITQISLAATCLVVATLFSKKSAQAPAPAE